MVKQRTKPVKAKAMLSAKKFSYVTDRSFGEFGDEYGKRTIAVLIQSEPPVLIRSDSRRSSLREDLPGVHVPDLDGSYEVFVGKEAESEYAHTRDSLDGRVRPKEIAVSEGLLEFALALHAVQNPSREVHRILYR